MEEVAAEAPNIAAELEAMLVADESEVVHPLKVVFVAQRGNGRIDAEGVEAADFDARQSAGGGTEKIDVRNFRCQWPRSSCSRNRRRSWRCARRRRGIR